MAVGRELLRAAARCHAQITDQHQYHCQEGQPIGYWDGHHPSHSGQSLKKSKEWHKHHLLCSYQSELGIWRHSPDQYPRMGRLRQQKESRPHTAQQRVQQGLEYASPGEPETKDQPGGGQLPPLRWYWISPGPVKSSKTDEGISWKWRDDQGRRCRSGPRKR